ncbi:catalase [Rhodococcus sp. WMMA185]|uniref:catalase family peroxidase n=1 Tax=Rhodococcus sp. WMMA185 TaxID=679318 RepID=UPI000878055F|nr:catalase family peroxidase [Rhodococcus sp. WMMA185]AOW94800.1 catalase [Rhodococcus sp. WMMA185]
MSDEEKPDASPTLSRRGVLLGLAALGGIAAVDVGGFLYAGGWLTPGRLTPSRFTDRFQQVFGKHDGFRRNHAKGLSASGHFISNGAGAEISRAVVFQPGEFAVEGRFSLSGGVPDVADANATVRGLGLLFTLPNGEQWRTAMVNIPVFFDNTPEGFFERILASKPDPATGNPDPDKMAAFLARHPETAAAMEIIGQNPPSSGFDNSTFYGLNAFRVTDSLGAVRPVRWMVVPEQPFEPADPVQPPGRDYLFDALIRKVADTPLYWRLILTIGQPGDPTNDATVPWPPHRHAIDAGRLTIDSVQTEEQGNARDINFDPLILPYGIARSDDPLLSARSAVYAKSFQRRSSEPKTPSAVNVERVLDER